MKLYYYKIVEKRNQCDKTEHYFCSSRNDFIKFLDKCYKDFCLSEEAKLHIEYFDKNDNRKKFFEIKIDDYDFYGSEIFSSKRKFYKDFKDNLKEVKTPERVEEFVIYGFEDLETIRKERVKELEPYRYNPIEGLKRTFDLMADMMNVVDK